MKNTQYIEAFFLVNFFAYGIALALGMILSYLLFKSLKKKYPTYYKSIGEPLVFPPMNVTWGGYIQCLKSGVFAYPMIFRGIPKDFPEDRDLRKIAQAIRICLTVVVVLFIMQIILSYFLHQSDPSRWALRWGW